MTATLPSDPAADSQMLANKRGRTKSKHMAVVSTWAARLCCSSAGQTLDWYFPQRCWLPAVPCHSCVVVHCASLLWRAKGRSAGWIWKEPYITAMKFHFENFEWGQGLHAHVFVHTHTQNTLQNTSAWDQPEEADVKFHPPFRKPPTRVAWPCV